MNRIKKALRWLLLMLPLWCIGCGEESSQPIEPVEPLEAPRYGYYYLGEEAIPVMTYTMVEEYQFLLKLSPLEEVISATTYAIVGVHTDWLGKEMDVTYRFHNDDYIFVYEDPVRYYSPYRPLQSGTILLDRNEEGYIKVKVDVVLYDGTTFRYENDSIAPEPLEQE